MADCEVKQNKFYEITQNNSGGTFVTNDKLCHRLFIEANDQTEAKIKAEYLGCYWDGVANGRDCPCCGDRWYGWFDKVNLDEWKKEGYLVNIYDHYTNPEELWYKKYSKYTIVEEPKWRTSSWGGSKSFEGKIAFPDIRDYAQFLANEYGWTTPDARIYYKDGRIIEIFTDKN